MKTKAAILTQLNHPLEILDLEIPALQKGQVLVKLASSGLCRSQLNEIKGYKGNDPYLPHTLGHEGSGVVLEVGPEVTKVTKDQAVILTWIKGNGLEFFGTKYGSKIGAVNSGPISTFMEYAVVSENRLIPIANKISLKEAALFGCAIPTGAGIVFNDLKVKPGSSIAIFGVGGIGLSAVCAAYCCEAEKIIVIDVEEDKLDLALKLGATHKINAATQDVISQIHQITGNAGADYTIEAVGNKGIMETAFKATKAGGGTCIVAGNVPSGQLIQIDPFDLIRGKKLVGSWGGGTNPDKDIPFLVDKFKSKSLRTELLISHETSLEKINEAFALLDARKVARALVNFE